MISRKQREPFLEYKRELVWKKFSGLATKLLTLIFLGIFLILLFKAHYTDSPSLVVFNYLALLTGISGIIQFKYYEIPNILLKLSTGDTSFFSLSDSIRIEILTETLSEFGIFPIPLNLETWDEGMIRDTLPLSKRWPWKKIGKIYFALYISTVVLVFMWLGKEFGRI